MVLLKMFKIFKNIFLSIGRKSPIVLSSNETLDYILNNKVSVGRYGDGELNIMLGNNIKFQEFNNDLSKRLMDIKSSDKFLVCIPDVFDKKRFNKKYLTDQEFKYWKKNKLLFSYAWKKYFNKQMLLGDANISRFYIRYRNKSGVEEYVNKLKKIWNDKNLIIVEGMSSKVGCENDLLDNAKSIRRIVCPNKNAFNKYDQILKAVKDNYKIGDLVLIALGPTATVLAYDLSRENIQALDLGHFDIEYEWFLSKTTEKIPVKNKNVNECNSVGDEDFIRKNYANQIIVNLNN